MNAIEDLRRIVEASIINQPRSLQAWAGPSELAIECSRCLVRKLAQIPPAVPEVAAWLPFTGTALHNELACILGRHENMRADLGMPHRYLIEHRVTVGVVGGVERTGSVDVFDTQGGHVVDWKGLKPDTLIPTVDGWKQMREIAVGDRLFDRRGHATKVTHVFPRTLRQAYRMTFTNGTEVVCDDIHQWFAHRGNNAKRDEYLLTAGDIAELLQRRNSNGSRMEPCSIPLAGALDLPDAPLPIPPYTFGAWIGDGMSRTGIIGKPDDDLFKRIESDGYEVKPPTDPRRMCRRIVGLTAQLRAMGVLHDGKGAGKRIPREYLRASRRQRLDLLRGLMDTDGTWSTGRGEAIFTQVDRGFADDVAELVASLGWRPYVAQVTGMGYGKEVKSWRVAFAPTDYNPFHLRRKADLVRVSMSPRRRRSDIRSVEPLGKMWTQCIAVDSPDHSFLCTRDMLPTHNCVGTTTMRAVRKGEVRKAYIGQVQLYGRGLEDAGHEVSTVSVYFLPRNGLTLAEAVPVTIPYSRDYADAVLARANSICEDIATNGVDAALEVAGEHTGEEFSCGTWPHLDGPLTPAPKSFGPAPRVTETTPADLLAS